MNAVSHTLIDLMNIFKAIYMTISAHSTIFSCCGILKIKRISWKFQDLKLICFAVVHPFIPFPFQRVKDQTVAPIAPCQRNNFREAQRSSEDHHILPWYLYKNLQLIIWEDRGLVMAEDGKCISTEPQIHC